MCGGAPPIPRVVLIRKPFSSFCVQQLKQMEMQLEEEYEEKQKVLREKRDLEGKLAAVSDQVQ